MVGWRTSRSSSPLPPGPASAEACGCWKYWAGVEVHRWHHLHRELREHQGLQLGQNLVQTFKKVNEQIKYRQFIKLVKLLLLLLQLFGFCESLQPAPFSDAVRIFFLLTSAESKKLNDFSVNKIINLSNTLVFFILFFF